MKIDWLKRMNGETLLLSKGQIQLLFLLLTIMVGFFMGKNSGARPVYIINSPPNQFHICNTAQNAAPKEASKGRQNPLFEDPNNREARQKHQHDELSNILDSIRKDIIQRKYRLYLENELGGSSEIFSDR